MEHVTITNIYRSVDLNVQHLIMFFSKCSVSCELLHYFFHFSFSLNLLTTVISLFFITTYHNPFVLHMLADVMILLTAYV